MNDILQTDAGNVSAETRARQAVTRPQLDAGRLEPIAHREAPPDKRFWVNCGPILKDLADLRDALASEISDAQFAHHVSRAHNDFARWIEDVLGDSQSAAALRRARTRNGALKALNAALSGRPPASSRRRLRA